MLAALIADPTSSAKTHAPPGPPCFGRHITAKQARQFVGKVWRLDHWKRGVPGKLAIVGYRHKLQCAAGRGHRHAIKHRWRKAKDAFFEHRRIERSWIGCPIEIRAASEAFRVDADLLYGIEGAESSHLGGNWFGLLDGAEGVDVSNRAASAMQAARLMRRLHDELGGWPAAMWAYSGGSYDISHPYALSGDVCP